MSWIDAVYVAVALVVLAVVLVLLCRFEYVGPEEPWNGWDGEEPDVPPGSPQNPLVFVKRERLP